MNRPPRLATVAASATLICLSSCAIPAVTSQPSSAPSKDPAAAYRAAANRGSGPDVEEMSVGQGRSLAAEWCADLEVDNLGWAVRSVNERASQLDAVEIGLFALNEVCPELHPKAQRERDERSQ